MACGERESLAPIILNHGIGWLLSSQIYAPAALLAAKKTRYPLAEGLCGLQRWSEPFGVYQFKAYEDDLAADFSPLKERLFPEV